MKNALVIYLAGLGLSVSASFAATLCSGNSLLTTVDLAHETRIAKQPESIRYSTAWETNGSAGAIAVVAVNGEAIASSAGGGAVEWRPTRNGTYTLTHRVLTDGLQVGETLTATFEVNYCNASATISPASGIVYGWPVSVTMSCDTEGAIIHYTTDGSEPSASSPVYRRFHIYGRTVVKAVAVKDGLVGDVAVVDYRLGVFQPTITASPSFTGAKTLVSLVCDTEGATILYTLDGTEPNPNSTCYTTPFYVTNSCTVKAYAVCEDCVDSSVVSFTITKIEGKGIGDTLGAPDQAFETGGDLPFVCVTDNTAPLGESMKSGAITHSQQSTLSTTVLGAGTISFKWKTSCEDSNGEYDWDHAEFWVDGTRIAQLDGQTAWQTVTQAISGDGSHTLLWKYVKDDMSSEGEDCCWVADYHWASAYTATQTTEVPVPYVWLRGHFPHTPDEYDAYESAAKETAANGVNKVWECYVAGLVPTNAADVFHAVISMEGGNPVIGWTPDLNEGGAKQERVYTVEGRESLTSGSWGPTNAASRFFRVKVALP